MNRKIKFSLITLGLVGLMAVPAFANHDILRNHRPPWGEGRRSNIEVIADKAGVPVEELLERRESGECCRDFIEDYGLTAEEIEEERLQDGNRSHHNCRNCRRQERVRLNTNSNRIGNSYRRGRCH